jgi:aldose 1-epimerase
LREGAGGGDVVRLITPDRHGKRADIAIGFDNPRSYAATLLNFGTMGRYANRLGKGEITMDGTTF